MISKVTNKYIELLLIAFICTGLTGLQAQAVRDIDGNVYNTITIGTQVWLKENLKTTRYSNGDSIGTTIPATLDITFDSTHRYQWVYNGIDSNLATYGRLYTWFAAADSRRICPAGWHVPSDAEWTILTDYLAKNGYGFKGIPGETAKSLAATSGWDTDKALSNIGNDQISNNKSGFTAFAGGYRYGSGLFNGFGKFGYWWSATKVSATSAWYRDLSFYSNDMYRGSTSKLNGVSIRCLRD